jgi:hypothetical protein
MSYDNDNNLIRTEFFGSNERLVFNLYGVAGSDLKYKNGYLEETVRFDSAHHVTKAASTGDGIAIIRNSYDSAGNKLSEGFYGETGSPINDHSGVHAIYYQFSPMNMMTRMACFDLDEKPSLNRDKMHCVYLVHDSIGRIAEQAYYGLFLQPVKDFNDQVCMTRYRYDSSGRKSFLSFWKDSITSMPRWSGAYAQRYTFNEICYWGLMGLVR